MRDEAGGACRRKKIKLTSKIHLAVREAVGPNYRRREERSRVDTTRTFNHLCLMEDLFRSKKFFVFDTVALSFLLD